MNRVHEYLQGSELEVVWKSNGNLKGIGAQELEKLGPLETAATISYFNKFFLDSKSNPDGQYEGFKAVLEFAAVAIASAIAKSENGASVRETIHEETIDGTIETMEKTTLQLWLEHSFVLELITTVFEDTSDSIPDLKKLALDLGYVLLSRSLDFLDDSLGMKAPLKRYQVQMMSLTAKYLESFMVTFPTHYPFMPAKHFAAIRWPVAVTDSCSGKVHSIFKFLPTADSLLEETESSSEDGAEDHAASATPKYCNYENVSRRQPWGGKFSTIQLLNVVHEVLESQAFLQEQGKAVASKKQGMDEKGLCLTSIANDEDCASLLPLIQNVLSRVRKVDPSLLYRDKSKSPLFIESAACYMCGQHIGSLFDRLNPFGSIFRKSEPPPKSAASVASTDTSSSMSSIHRSIPSVGVKGSAETVNVLPLPVKPPPSSSIVTQPRHHCRLCLRSMCASCSAADSYVGERICHECGVVVKAMQLSDLQEKKPKRNTLGRALFGSGSTPSEQSEQTPSTDVSPSQLDDLVSTIAAGNSEWKDLDYPDRSLCCSILLTESLRSWRDQIDD